MTLWQLIVSWLVWLSADPVDIDLESPRAAAAVAVARASMVTDAAPPAPGPTPADCDCGRTCVRGTWKPDGNVSQVCKCQCQRCVAERSKSAPEVRADCQTGKCLP